MLFRHGFDACEAKASATALAMLTVCYAGEAIEQRRYRLGANAKAGTCNLTASVCRVGFDAQVHAGAVADVLDGIAEQIADGVFQWSQAPSPTLHLSWSASDA
jgi:hypothetical protein